MHNLNAVTDEEEFKIIKKKILAQIEALQYKRDGGNEHPHYIIMVCPHHPSEGDDEDFVITTAGCDTFLVEAVDYLIRLLEFRERNESINPENRVN